MNCRLRTHGNPPTLTLPSMPRSWIIMQIAIVVLVALSIGIAAVKLWA